MQRREKAYFEHYVHYALEMGLLNKKIHMHTRTHTHTHTQTLHPRHKRAVHTPTHTHTHTHTREQTRTQVVEVCQGAGVCFSSNWSTGMAKAQGNEHTQSNTSEMNPRKLTQVK